MKACLADPGVNGVLLLYTPQGNARPDEMATDDRGARQEVAASRSSPRSWEATPSSPGREILNSAAIPCYSTPEEAVRTYMSMYRYARNLELLYETPAELPIDIAPPKHNLQAMLRRVVRSGRSVLTEEESKRFITTYGFPVVPQMVAESAERGARGGGEDRLPGGAQGDRARDHPQELGRRRRDRGLLAG